MSERRPRVVIVMGVSGSGKSTIGKKLAERLGCAYFDADTFHSPEAIAKMKSGASLTDADRKPWLERIAAKIDALRAAGESGVIGCSALKRAYRDLLIGPVRRRTVDLVYLKGSIELIRGRIEARKGHFMPPALLQSQFDALEAPTPDEQPIIVDIAPKPDAIVDAIAQGLARADAA